MFPHGCHLLPDSISEAMDFDETKTRRPDPRRERGDLRGREGQPSFWHALGTITLSACSPPLRKLAACQREVSQQDPASDC